MQGLWNEELASLKKKKKERKKQEMTGQNNKKFFLQLSKCFDWSFDTFPKLLKHLQSTSDKPANFMFKVNSVQTDSTFQNAH